MIIFAYYTITVIILAAVDAWRRKRVMGKVDNINHWLSYLLAVICVVGLWVLFHGWHLNWQAIPFVFACGGIRGVLYDPALNLFNREKLDYQSTTSNSREDSILTLIGFWPRRLIYLVTAIAAVIVYTLLH